MPKTHSDVFALRKSGLDAFLYAGVGAEANGSTLTILSIFARLGKDSWAEAARLAALPQAAMIDSLAESIAAMPLPPSVLAGAHDTAARLVQLLPRNTPSRQQSNAAQTATVTLKVVPFTMVYFAFAVWMALNVFMTTKAPSHGVAPLEQSATTPAATHLATSPLSKGTPVAGSSVAPRVEQLNF